MVLHPSSIQDLRLVPFFFSAGVFGAASGDAIEQGGGRTLGGRVSKVVSGGKLFRGARYPVPGNQKKKASLQLKNLMIFMMVGFRCISY